MGCCHYICSNRPSIPAEDAVHVITTLKGKFVAGDDASRSAVLAYQFLTGNAMVAAAQQEIVGIIEGIVQSIWLSINICFG